MTAIDTTTLDSLIQRFKQLPSSEKFVVLGKIYLDFENTLPALGNPEPSKEIKAVVNQVLNLGESEQLSFLQSVFSGDQQNAGSTLPGYKNLSESDRLELWYILGGKMGKGFAKLPENYEVSAEAQDLIRALDYHEANDKIRFMSQIAQHKTLQGMLS